MGKTEGGVKALAAAGLSWLLRDFAMGGRVGPGFWAELRSSHRISRVADVRAEARDDPAVLDREGVRLLWMPIPDHHPLSMQQLQEGVAWIVDGLTSGERVLVHCEHGIGRSALLSCAALVQLGMSPSAALARAKRIRPIVSPSPDQLHALINWAKFLGRPAVPEWDELARIAYK